MKLLRRLCAAVGFVALVSGCSSVPEAETPEQERYLSKVEAAQLEFSMPSSELEAGIDRATSWLSKYHSLECSEADRVVFKRVTRDTETGLIESPMTYRPGDLGSTAYSVAFFLLGATVQVDVMYEHEGGFGLEEVVEHNAHVLAHYIKTGELIPELVGH